MRSRVGAVLSLVVAFAAVPCSAGVNRWTLSLPMTPAPWAQGSAVAIDRDSSIAYAATTAGIFKTVSRGSEWSLVHAFGNASAIAIDPQNSARILAGNVDAVGYRAELRLSENGGVTWRRVHTFAWENWVAAFAFDPAESATVYAALGLSGIGKSVDGGETWTISDFRNGLKCCLIDFWHTTDVSIGGRGSSTVFTSSDLLQRSVDGATSWQEVTLPLPLDARSVSVDPTDRARLYVTGFLPFTNDAVAFTTDDGGHVWRQLPPAAITGRITVDPRSPTTLYAVRPVSLPRSTRGVIRSLDRGLTWTEFSDGIPIEEDVNSVVVEETGSFLYANTPAGVFVYERRDPPRRRAARR